MKSLLCLAVFVGAAACQRDAAPPPAPVAAGSARSTGSAGSAGSVPPIDVAAYAKDIEALCDAFDRSGAAQLPAHARQLTIAQWLPANLQTSASREFLVRIQPLVGEPKAAALDAEAKRVGLAGCRLAAEWRTPTP
ncbi:MAG: hypothetical protein H0X17_12410 [Deltaproteobacteria bacterium]|nr:hypothetical protein [Deltaproteobacteria bacterium]